MNLKSHVTFSKQQRHGIFLLLVIIAVLQVVYFYLRFSEPEIPVKSAVIASLEREVDSLKRIELNNRTPKLYPVNPNYFNDYRGSLFGMSNEEIDRLLAFRKEGKWINSVAQFQSVTQVSDALLDSIIPYLKFPEWTKNQKATVSSTEKILTFAQKGDLNTATAKELRVISGVGPVLSDRIIKYRNRFVDGFISDIQLQDVYGLTPETISNIKKEFTVKSPRKINRININTASIDDLVTVQHIDYPLAHNIIEERTLREGFKSWDELKKVKGFPADKIEIIQLYLQIE
ncbi:ComEA family DNA-binding protein [Gaetbulibacter aestuarii]|uniref:Helix-hairpin-helix domain-containing protein n=1 Tax=Gaetbulibacter aestuarii TaxID=1502358 RepID=A0ABW7MYJ0_9FLAO